MFPFQMDEESGIPLWVQLRNRLVYLINTGYFRAGEKLPTVHSMASELSINYNTVNKVYMSLASEGYITSKRGVGAVVNSLDHEDGAEEALAVEEAIKECVAACTDLGLSLKDIEKAVQRYIRKVERQRSGTMADVVEFRAPTSGSAEKEARNA